MNSRFLFVDSAVQDQDVLLNSIPSDIEVVRVSKNSSGIGQIAAALKRLSGVSEVHVVCHGRPGSVRLGSSDVALSNLKTPEADIESIRAALDENAVLMIYGCSVARGGAGKMFVETLASVFQASVCAATRVLGSLGTEANWDLDFAVGSRRCAPVFHSSELMSYRWALSTPPLNLFETPEFLVSLSAYANSNLDRGKVLKLAPKRFAVVGMTAEDGQGDISVRILEEDGTGVVDELRVNETVSGPQLRPDAASLGNGTFVVTWDSWNGQDGDGAGIYGRIVREDGTFLGPEFQVNTYIAGNQGFNRVAALSDGRFVVTWDDAGQVNGRLFSEAGDPIGDAFIISGQAVSFRREIASSSSGRFVVTWSDPQSDGSGQDILARVYDANGVGEAVVSVSDSEAADSLPHVTALADGSFVVVWEAIGAGSNGLDVYGQRLTSSGERTGNNFRINTTRPGDQHDAMVHSLLPGNVLATWISEEDNGSGSSVFGRIYATNGSSVTNEFAISSDSTGDKANQSVTPLGDGTFLVTWDSFGDGDAQRGVYGQVIQNNGTLVGSEIPIHVAPLGIQISIPEVVSLSEGTFTAIWSDFSLSGTHGKSLGSGIEFQAEEDSPLPIDGLYVSDADGNLRSVDLTVLNGTLKVGPTSGGALQGNGTSHILISGTESQINAALDNLVYQGSKDFHGVDTLMAVSRDSGGAEDRDLVSIVVTPVDDAPTISMLAAGAEFRVNSTTDGHQYGAEVTRLTDGRFVAVWVSSGQDGGGEGVYGQIFSASGSPVGSEFRVNGVTTGDQLNPKITSLDNGRFVAIWESLGQDGSLKGVFGRVYGSDGMTLGGEFRVNTSVSLDQSDPQVAAIGNGDFVVTWTSDGQDGDGLGVYGQRFNASGNKLGSEFRVNAASEGDQYDSGVVALADGGFAVSWLSSTPSDPHMFLRVYSQEGVPLGNAAKIGANVTPEGIEIGVNSSEFPDQQVTPLPSGDILVTWQNTVIFGEGPGFGLRGQLVSRLGVPGGQFVIASDGEQSSQPLYHDTVVLKDGGFVVVWQGESVGGDSVVGGRVYSPTGLPGREGFFVSEYPSFRPQAAALANGGFAVTLSSVREGSVDVVSRIFDAAGHPTDTEFRVNSYTPGYQQSPHIVSLEEDGFTVLWHSYEQDGSGSGVFGKVFGPEGTFEAREDVPLRLTNITSWDVDGDLEATTASVWNGSLHVDVSGGAIATYGSGGGQTYVTLSGTEAQINSALATLEYLGDPDFFGSDSLTIYSMDSKGGSASVTSSINVTPVNDILMQGSPLDDQYAAAGFPFEWDLPEFVIDVDGDVVYTVESMDGGTIPAWLTFDSGAPRLSGTPGGSDVGSFELRFTASDSTVSLSDVVRFTVAPNGSTVVGDDFVNELVGTEGSDVIDGRADNDTLRGLGGYDVLKGGEGNDVLNGGVGIDTLTGGPGADEVTGTLEELDGDQVTDFALGDVIRVTGVRLEAWDYDPVSGQVRIGEAAGENVVLRLLAGLDQTKFWFEPSELGSQQPWTKLGYGRDGDGDGVADEEDNALGVANPDQRDTDSDGYGNVVDADLNQDLMVDLIDLSLFEEAFSTEDANADFNGDGAVDLFDLSLLDSLFGAAPGPSAAHPVPQGLSETLADDLTLMSGQPGSVAAMMRAELFWDY